MKRRGPADFYADFYASPIAIQASPIAIYAASIAWQAVMAIIL